MSSMHLSIQKNELDVIGIKYGHLPRIEKILTEMRATVRATTDGREDAILKQLNKIAEKKSELEAKLKDVQTEAASEVRLVAKIADMKDEFGIYYLMKK